MKLPFQLHDRMRFVVGISGGKDSDSALLWLKYESGIPASQIIAISGDTKNEHDWTYAHIRMLNDRVHPVTTLQPEKGFYELAFSKKGFPSGDRRFCTEMLKIVPALQFIQEIRGQVLEPISVSGVRADESPDRVDLPEWDYSGNLLCKEWRPLIRWKFADVVAIHRKYDIPFNPLYALGARRVGCFPCFMSVKREIRIIALQFPERIAMIREWEQKMEREYGRVSTFFRPNVCPPRYHDRDYVCEDGSKITVATIDAVVTWALTGYRCKGTWETNPEPEAKGCNSGFCE